MQLFDLLTDIIAEVLATRSAHEFVVAGQAAGLPCALTQTPAQFVQDPQPAARDFFIESSRPGTGSLRIPGPPFISDPSLITYRRPAPRLGEANEQVYVHELGHSVGELERWRADGLV